MVLVWYKAELHLYSRGFIHITKLMYRGLLVALIFEKCIMLARAEIESIKNGSIWDILKHGSFWN